METLIFAINCILPIILVIALGYQLKKTGFFDGAFLKVANKLVFNVGLPFYLFYNVYNIESLQGVKWDIVAYCAAFILGLFFVAYAITLFFTKDRGNRGALIQCTFRSNFAIIGIPLADAIGGSKAVALAAVLSAVSIPLFNVLAVITLSIFGGKSKEAPSVKSIALSIAKNPLIIGVAAGLLCLLIRNTEPLGADGSPVFTIKNNLPFLYKAIGDVSAVASPLALIVLGGQFTLSAVKELAGSIAYGALWRLVITPGLGIGLAAYFTAKGVLNADVTVYPALIALFGSPVAVSSAIMAEAMDCSGELARQLVVWTSLLSIITTFVFIAVMRSLGLI